MWLDACVCARGEEYRLRFSPGDIRYRTIFFGQLCLRRERQGERNREGEGCLLPKNLPNVSNGLRVHAILFSQCSAARAHELGILRALRVNVLRLHHHNTERKQLISRIFVMFPYLNVFLHHASTLTTMGKYQYMHKYINAVSASPSCPRIFSLFLCPTTPGRSILNAR